MRFQAIRPIEILEPAAGNLPSRQVLWWLSLLLRQRRDALAKMRRAPGCGSVEPLNAQRLRAIRARPRYSPRWAVNSIHSPGPEVRRGGDERELPTRCTCSARLTSRDRDSVIGSGEQAPSSLRSQCNLAEPEAQPAALEVELVRLRRPLGRLYSKRRGASPERGPVRGCPRPVRARRGSGCARPTPPKSTACRLREG